MPNKRYQQGYRFELLVKKKWEDKGYFVVRAAGSHGLADLVALANSSPPHCEELEVYLIQCKATGKIGKKERDDLKELARGLGVTAVLAYREGKEYKEEVL